MLTRKQEIRLTRIVVDYTCPPNEPVMVLRILQKIAGSFNHPIDADDFIDFLKRNGLPIIDDGTVFDLPEDL